MSRVAFPEEPDETRTNRRCLLAAVAVDATARADTLKFTPTSGVPPSRCASLSPNQAGDIVETQTFSKPGDYYDPATAGRGGRGGAVLRRGVTPQDTLVVKILKLRPNRDTAISAVRRMESARWRPMVARGCSTIRCRRAVRVATRSRAQRGHPRPARSAMKRIEIPLAPMLGRLAVAPAGAKRGAASGPATSAATWMPPTSPRAPRSTCPCSRGRLLLLRRRPRAAGRRRNRRLGPRDDDDVTFQFDVIKGRRSLATHREREHIMVAGSVRPLIDAFRIAHVELIECWWRLRFDKIEALQVVSQAGTARVANVVDPNYTVVAKFPKALLREAR